VIDTVRLKFEKPLTTGLYDAEIPDGEFSGRNEVSVVDKRSGLRLIHKRNVGPNRNAEISAVEVSLSRLHSRRDNNSRPLRSQSEVDEAMRMLWKIFGKYAPPPLPGSWAFSRIDLAWDFYTNAQHFIHAHSHATHALCESWAATYSQNGLTTGRNWVGTDMVIKFYDRKAKARHLGKQENKPEIVRKLPHTLRVEIEFKGQRLKKLLGKGQLVRRLDFAHCYQTFRKILLEFAPQAKEFVPIREKDEAIFLAEFKGLQVLTQLLSPSSGISAPTRRELRKKYPRWLAHRTTYKVDWHWMLPPQFPPARSVWPPTAVVVKAPPPSG
jgi:hypothetical protein